MSKYNWKDQQLDTIWHHGVKLFTEGKIDQYELLNRIEEQMADAIKHVEIEVLTEVVPKIIGEKETEVTGQDGWKYQPDERPRNQQIDEQLARFKELVEEIQK